MVHTASLTYTHYDNAMLWKYVQIQGIKKLKNTNFIATAYENIGFTHIIFYRGPIELPSGKTIQRYTIYIRIDFIKLCGYGLINKLRATDLTKTIEKNFNDRINQINPCLPQFDEWKVKRIDYSIDLNVKDPQLYIELLQKGDVLNASYKKLYDRIAKRRKYLDGSVYLRCKSKTVNFYAKYEQLQNENKLPDDEEERQQLQQILRLEIQITNINAFKKEYGIQINQLKYFLNPMLSIELIKKYYGKIVANKGDYYILPEAKENVDASDYAEEEKETLKTLLEDIANARSIENYKKHNARLKIDSLITKLEVLGINPVCITQKQQRKYNNVKHLPSLYNRITNDIEKRIYSECEGDL